MIHYTEHGTGPAVLLLHGFCEGKRLWEGLSGYLANNHRVICPDLPGHGDSPLSDSISSLDDIASTLWEWLDDINVSQCAVIGHSLGGYVALAMLSQQPKRVTGIGLFHSTALADSAEKKQNRNKAIDFISRNGDAAFKKNFIPSLFHRDCAWLPQLTEMVNDTAEATILAYSAWMRDRPSRVDLLEKGELSVLIVAGVYDEFIPLATLEVLSEKIPEVTLAVLADSGHLGMWEEPMEARLVLEDWLESIF